MPHDVLRHRLQSVVTCQNVVLLVQFLFELRFLCWVERGGFNEVVDVFVQVWINQIQLRGAVLVEQRHCRTVFDTLLKIVNGNVVTEDLLGAFLTRDERGAGER